MSSVQETQGPAGYKGSSCSSHHQEVTPFGRHSRPNSLLGLLIALNFIFSHQRKLRNFRDPMTFRRAQGAEAGQVVYSLCRANAPGCGWCRPVAPTTHTSRNTPARTMCAPPGTLGPRATALPGPRLSARPAHSLTAQVTWTKCRVCRMGAWDTAAEGHCCQGPLPEDADISDRHGHAGEEPATLPSRLRPLPPRRRKSHTSHRHDGTSVRGLLLLGI